MLMERGADPSVADKAGKLPAQVAENMNVFHAIVEGTEVAKLRARITDMRDEICSLRGVVEALREENESLRAQADVLHDEADERGDDVAELWRRANAQDMRERHRSRLAALTEAMEAAAGALEGLEGAEGGAGASYGVTDGGVQM